MCGMHRTTVSPSSSSTSRSTPCVAGCWGPMLMSICSPASSGSTAGGASSATGEPPSSTTRGTRCGRPCASRPLVESSTSTVRRVVAMPVLFPRLLASAQPPAHVVRQILKRLSDRELLLRVPRLRICRERLPQLLGAAETTAKGKVLPQRIPFLVLLPHQQSAQIGVAREADAEHVVALPLHPIGGAVDAPYARHLEGHAFLEQHLEAEKAPEWQRPKVPHDLERLFEISKLHRRDVGQIVVLLRGIVVQPSDDLEQLAALDHDRGLAPNHGDGFHAARESLPQRLRARIRSAAAMRYRFRRRGRGGLLRQRASRDDRPEARAHNPLRV